MRNDFKSQGLQYAHYILERKLEKAQEKHLLQKAEQERRHKQLPLWKRIKIYFSNLF